MAAACHTLLEAANDAKEEMEGIRDRASHVRSRGEAYREASEAMKAVEDEQKLVDAQLGEASAAAGSGGVGDSAGGEGVGGEGAPAKRKRSASILGRVKSLAVRASGVLGDAEKTAKPLLALAGNKDAREAALKQAFDVFDSDGSGGETSPSCSCYICVFPFPALSPSLSPNSTL